MFTPHDPTRILILLVGGSMLLLYGVKLVTGQMEQLFGGRLRLLVGQFTDFPLGALISGLIVTLFTQSSTATASITIGLVSNQVISLATAVTMLLGAAVGSTLVVQLLAFHLTDYALECLGLAAGLAFLTQRTKFQDIGRSIFSFGLILTGLAMINVSCIPISKSDLMNEAIATLSHSPLVLLLLGILLSTVFVSSIAAIGIVMAMAAGGSLSLSAALAVTLGANIGSTLTPLFVAFSQGNILGRRLGLIYTGTRLVGTIVVLFLLTPCTFILASLFPTPASQIAGAHFSFNLLLAILFVPLSGRIADLSTQLCPEPKKNKQKALQALDPNVLELPGVALGQATREVLRMADLTAEMLRLSLQAFEENTVTLPKYIRSLDDRVDELESAIKHYLIQLNDAALSEEQAQQELSLLYVSTELEAIGDIVDRQLMRLARRKQRRKIILSEPEWQDIVIYHREVMGLLQRVLAGLASQDRAIAREALLYRSHLQHLKRDMHVRHLQQLTSGQPTNLDASAIHLEMVNAISQILSHTCSIARVIQGDL